MDPLSITTSSLALISVVAKTSIAITTFIRECREARGDLISVNRELSELKIVLELLQEDTAGQDGKLLLSESLQLRILSIIQNCGDVSTKVHQVLTDLRGSRVGAIKWVLDCKKEVASFKQSLEAHRSALSLALEMVNMRVDSIQACCVSSLINLQYHNQSCQGRYRCYQGGSRRDKTGYCANPGRDRKIKDEITSVRS